MSTHRILCNSWPKAGTHVLLEAARLLIGDGPWYRDPDIKYPGGDPEFLAQAGERLRRYGEASFAIKGHYGRTPVLEAFIAEHRFAHLFAVRDPREVLCSTQRWLRDLRANWAISRHLAALDPDAQLERIILGLPVLPPFDVDHAIRWDQPLPGRYEALTRWVDVPSCRVFTYEDLTGMRGESGQFAAIEDLMDCLGMAADPDEVTRIARHICNPSSATFHTGPSSDWEKVFTDRHRHLFVELGGEVLVERFGYAPTLRSPPRGQRVELAVTAGVAPPAKETGTGADGPSRVTAMSAACAVAAVPG